MRTKNYAADPEIGFLKKSISRPYGRATAMPTAWELSTLCPESLKSDRYFLILPLRFRKAGRVWCGGAQETH